MSNIQKAKAYMLKSSILGQSLFEFKYQEKTDEVILIEVRNGTGTIEIPEFITSLFDMDALYKTRYRIVDFPVV